MPLAAIGERHQSQTLVRVERQQSGTTVSLHAVRAVNRDVVWAAGAGGTWARTIDGGTTWRSGRVRSNDSLDFMDIHAVNSLTAYVLSVGQGRGSSIWKTTDGGASWRWQFTNLDPRTTFRCFAFWSEDVGLVIGDGIPDQFTMLRTDDAGAHWSHVPPTQLTPAMGDERLGDSSGSCLVAGRRGRAWFVTTQGRVFRTTNRGKSWQHIVFQYSRTDSTGLVAMSFRDIDRGLMFGGPGGTMRDTLLFVTSDAGKKWDPLPRPPLRGGISSGTYVPETAGPTVVVVGHTGLTYSLDAGEHWTMLDTAPYNAVSASTRLGVWAVGEGGRILKVVFGSSQ
jgi:photosystem II stability/assembly factor-like uncharacterized protein